MNYNRVPGALFEITDAELAHADEYAEVAAYVRVVCSACFRSRSLGLCRRPRQAAELSANFAPGADWRLVRHGSLRLWR